MQPLGQMLHDPVDSFSHRVLVCGAGKVSFELLKCLGENWDISVIEKSESAVETFKDRFPQIARVFQGDASSPVVLEEADLKEHAFLLALTNQDAVNLAICRFAKEAGIKYILARANNSDKSDVFEELGVKTIMVNALAARTICHYLQDPQLITTPLALGQGEVLELDVRPKTRLVGRTCASLGSGRWRVAAIMRSGELIFPGRRTVIKGDDRVIIIAQPDSFSSIAGLLSTSQPVFPSAYGRELLVALLPQKNLPPESLIDEGTFLARTILVRRMNIIAPENMMPSEEHIQDLSKVIPTSLESADEDIWDEIYDTCSERSIGLVVIPPLDNNFLKSLVKPRLITLAHSLPCPLFVSRNSAPYARILVPFNNTPRAERALEAAMDLARQNKSEIAVVTVQSPEFLHGSEGVEWVEEVFRKVREMAHVRKTKVDEIVREGNPVREIVELAKDYDLLIVGSTTKDTGLFSPHVGELLTAKVQCSVLIMTA